jgi:hypothetical protein
MPGFSSFPKGPRVLDFFHAAEHLAAALDAAYGEHSPQSRAQFEKLRHVLRHDPKGADKVIRSLMHLRKEHPTSKVIARELEYFRKNRAYMQYELLASAGIPIGIGVTEAACKTLATQRLKCSGMAWRDEGGQAILSLRSFIQSGRFDAAWALLADGYRHLDGVAIAQAANNVVPIRSRQC